MTSSQSVSSSRAPVPVGPYPHARRVGSLLFVSGTGPRVPGSNEVPGNVVDSNGRVVEHDIERQARQCFANIRAILEDAGSSWDKIVDVTVFLTDMAGDFARFNRVYGEHFTANQPTRTTVEVGALPTPIHVELKVIATID
ncbi:MAG: Rid family detoxifying hydrolase [Gemmatimonadales bacterium]|nr:Rid family detoxifying hydrolase [Gemmatimonadales bacterium]